jgi:hypothetical protein
MDISKCFARFANASWTSEGTNAFAARQTEKSLRDRFDIGHQPSLSGPHLPIPSESMFAQNIGDIHGQEHFVAIRRAARTTCFKFMVPTGIGVRHLVDEILDDLFRVRKSVWL